MEMKIVSMTSGSSDHAVFSMATVFSIFVEGKCTDAVEFVSTIVNCTCRRCFIELITATDCRKSFTRNKNAYQSQCSTFCNSHAFNIRIGHHRSTMFTHTTLVRMSTVYYTMYLFVNTIIHSLQLHIPLEANFRHFILLIIFGSGPNRQRHLQPVNLVQAVALEPHIVYQS